MIFSEDKWYVSTLSNNSPVKFWRGKNPKLPNRTLSMEEPPNVHTWTCQYTPMTCFCSSRVDRKLSPSHIFHRIDSLFPKEMLPNTCSPATETEHPIWAGINPLRTNIAWPSLFTVTNDYVTKSRMVAWYKQQNLS